MSEPYVGQIIAVGFNFAPSGWAVCNGQVMSIADNQLLYSLIGTMYGGNGQTTFNLPDLRGRVAINQGQAPGLSNYVIGQSGGTEDVMLTANQLPQHTHAVAGTSASASSANPTTDALLGSTESNVHVYASPAELVALAPGSIGPAPGNSLPHENRQPFQAINYLIALQGIYPQQD